MVSLLQLTNIPGKLDLKSICTRLSCAHCGHVPIMLILLQLRHRELVTSMNWSGLICERNLRNSKKWILRVDCLQLNEALGRCSTSETDPRTENFGSSRFRRLAAPWTSVSLHFNLTGAMCFYCVFVLFMCSYFSILFLTLPNCPGKGQDVNGLQRHAW